MSADQKSTGAGLPRIGVKYCGGCNPLYERKAIVTQLKKDFPGITAKALADGSDFDVVLVLRGCRNPCSSYEDLSGSFGRVELDGPDQYGRIRAFVERWLSEHKE